MAGEQIKQEQSRGLGVKIDVNVSEALTGLKAVERQAKAATRALRELETYYTEQGKRYYVKWRQNEDDECMDIREVCMSDIPTEYLQRELVKRKPAIDEVFDISEGSVIHSISQNFGISPEELLRASPEHVELMWSTYISRRESELSLLSTEELIAEAKRQDIRRD